MNWTDPQQLADFITAIAPSVTGGLLALAGVIVLFFFQQRAQRKEARRMRLDLAAERIMETTELMIEARDSEALNRVIVASWKFSWLLDAKDAPVARWAFAKLIGAYEPGLPEAEHSQKMTLAFAVMMTGLNDWRLGIKKPRWFKEDLEKSKKLEEGSEEPTR